MVTGPCGWSQQLDAMLGWSMQTAPLVTHLKWCHRILHCLKISMPACGIMLHGELYLRMMTHGSSPSKCQRKLLACIHASLISPSAMKLVFPVHGIFYKIAKASLVIVRQSEMQEELWSLALVPGRAADKEMWSALWMPITVEQEGKKTHLKKHGFTLLS